ncbi:MAG: tetraacyldisaccharide 4'-kinase [Acidobacteriota bacterium]
MKPHRILYPFSLLYGAVMTIRNAFFENKLLKREEAGVPVISIGNLTTGGTGKTPLVELTAALVRDSGIRTAIVSRGYGRASSGLVVVSDGTRLVADAAQAGDEPHQLAEALPGVAVIVDEVRARGARYAVENFNAGCLILDDGFQHRSLDRSLDIVVIDGSQDLFSMPMLPSGYRREPLSALKRAGAFIITKADDPARVETLRARLRAYTAAPVFLGTYEPVALCTMGRAESASPDTIKGLRVAAFCGIGQPENFRRTLEALGADVAAFKAFADHHAYTMEECQGLERLRRETGATILVTTEKDAHRLSGLTACRSGESVRFVKMRAAIREHEEFHALIAGTAAGQCV